MSEVVDVLKIAFDKIGFKSALFSLIAAIIFYKLCLSDWLWSIVVFGASYFTICLTSYIGKQINRHIVSSKEKSEFERERQSRYYEMSLIYSSLPEYMQKMLITLYQLPYQTYVNVRVLNDFPAQTPIYNVCRKIEEEHQLIRIKRNFQSYIININEVFCDVLKDNARS